TTFTSCFEPSLYFSHYPPPPPFHPLSLHDALPISGRAPVLTLKPGQTVRIDTVSHQGLINGMHPVKFFGDAGIPAKEVLPDAIRSEEHTSELQSQSNLVCRLLLEKKKKRRM